MSSDGTPGQLVMRSPRRRDNFVSTGEAFLKPVCINYVVDYEDIHTFLIIQGEYIVVSHSLGTVGITEPKHRGILAVHRCVFKLIKKYKQLMGGNLAASLYVVR